MKDETRHVRFLVQCFRQLIENLIRDNHSDPAIESDTGQHWQFLQCLRWLQIAHKLKTKTIHNGLAGMVL